MGFNPVQAAAELESEAAKGKQFDPQLAADEILAGNASSAKEMLGANFDSESFAGPGLRWTLARGDNLAEKKLRIKKKYPEGDIRVLPESAVRPFL